MAYTEEQIRRAWKSTDGRCHLTGRRLRLSDYGRTWEIDHSKPRAKGGSDHGNNLKPALLVVNRSKQASTSRAVRRAYGLQRSPMSRAEQNRNRVNNAAGGAVLGAVAGGAMAGPVGALVGGVLGGLVGHGTKVE